MKPLYQIFVLFSIICLSTEGINSFMEELPFFRIKRELLYKCLKAPNTIPSGIINCIRNETNGEYVTSQIYFQKNIRSKRENKQTRDLGVVIWELLIVFLFMWL